MRINRSNRLALGAALLAFAMPAGLAAQTTESNVDKKITALETRIAQLESELNASKKPALINAQETTTPEGVPASPPANPQEARTETTTAPAAPPDPWAALK